MNNLYNGGPAPSFMNGRGDSKTVSGSRESSGLASLHSPPHSRSSSAQDSYSTSATTYEDPQDDGVQDRRGRDSGSKDKEPKGNVIVSVRVRPDAAGDKSSAKEWLVDGRQSLVAYRGREGGDYYYGKLLDLSVKLLSCYDTLSPAQAGWDEHGAARAHLRPGNLGPGTLGGHFCVPWRGFATIS